MTHGSSSSATYDALLRLPDGVWQQRRTGPLPDLGARLLVHPDLPNATVVSVIEAAGASSAAALLRLLSEPAALIHNDVARWRHILSGHGWFWTPNDVQTPRHVPIYSAGAPVIDLRGSYIT